MKLNFVLLALLIVLFLVLNLPHLLEFPPVWPDEAWIADVALNTAKTGYPHTEIWGNLIPDAPQHVFWYPPVFFYLLGFWFKIFGFSIETQRFFSLLVSALYIGVFYTFTRFMIAKSAPKLSNIKVLLLAFLGSALLILDPTFLKSAVISRPEILVLTLITCAGILVLKSTDLAEARLKAIFLIVSGLFVGISMMVHFLAATFALPLFFYLAISTKKFYLERNFYFFLISALIPIGSWFLMILPNFTILTKQLGVLAQSTTTSPNFLILSFSVYSPLHKLLFLIYLAISLIAVAVWALSKKSPLLLVSFLLAASWLLAYYGRIEWRAIYIVPFVYLALVLVLALKNLKIFILLILSILFILDINNYINLVSETADKSYLEFEKNFRSFVPVGKTVFLSTIPDVYYAFKAQGSYKLYDPLAKASAVDFEKLLTTVDYAVINSRFSYIYVGDTLDNYLKENTLRIMEVEGGGYRASVYELKH